VDLGRLVWCVVAGLFRSRAALHAEILVFRHQLNVLRRKSAKRLVFSNIDRLVFAALFGLMPSVCNALIILKPATVIAWHRAGLRAYWRWKSRPRGGRPRAPADVRPNLNACAERWARSVKEECLSKVILFGERSLR